MKREYKLYSTVFCIVLLLSGCQKQNEKIYHLYTSDPENSLTNIEFSSASNSVEGEQETIDEIEGNLIIYDKDFNRNNFYKWYIEAFNKKYPNVHITLNGPEEKQSTVAEDATKVSVDLMSGSAGDIIAVGSLPYMRYAKNNLFDDIYSYMKNDSEFYEENYYTNIFKAMEYRNKLYAVPMGFFHKNVRFNQTLLEKNQRNIAQVNSINYLDIIGIYNKISFNNDELILSRYFDSLILEENEYSRFLDEKEGKAYFNSQDYIDFLNEMKKLRWPEKSGRMMLFPTMEECADTVGENDLCLFVSSNNYQLDRNTSLFYEEPLGLTLPIPMSSTNGDKEFICPDKVFSISSTSKNKDLAWMFIKFFMEEKPIEILTDRDNWLLSGFSINRNNTLKKLEYAFGEGNEEAIRKIDQWNGERNEINILSHSFILFDEIKKITDEFYAGRKTAEDCAREVQERAEIYLKE